MPATIQSKALRTCAEQLREAISRMNELTQGLGDAPQWLYSVAFDARELWGAQAQTGLRVAIDAWEPYLEPA